MSGLGDGALFLAGPLMLLLAISRPRRREEWAVMILAVALIAVSLRVDSSLAGQTAHAAAAIFAGALVIATLGGIRSLATRILVSVGIAGAGTAGWLAYLGVRFSALQAYVVADIWRGWRGTWPELPPNPIDAATLAGMSATQLTAKAPYMSGAVNWLANLYPGMLAVTAMVAGWLAWSWYHRVSSRPLGLPPRPIAELRFNDQLIWGLIVAFGFTLFRLDETVSLVAANLLFTLVVLYSVRGMAITWYGMTLLPAPPMFKVAVTALLVLPLAIGGWLLIGVADTWLDIRQRMTLPQGVSS